MLSTKIDDYMTSLVDNFNISGGRIDQIEKISSYVSKEVKTRGKSQIVFVCTHNARRSQMAQVQLSAALAHIGIEDVVCLSAGTEKTSVHPNTILSLQEVGFDLSETSEGYELTSGDLSVLLSSKTIDSLDLEEGSLAIPVCDAADKNCPIVPNVAKRMALTYQDPGYADNTDQASKAYQKALTKIGEEMMLLALFIDERLETSNN